MKLILPANRPTRQARAWRVAQNDDAAIADLDGELMVRVGTGCVIAFGTLVERHGATLYRVSHRMLGDRMDAEDVVQECFARLWAHAPGWTSQGAGLVAWLHRVTMNLSLDRLRKPRHQVMDAIPEIEDRAPLQDSVIEAIEAREAIETALEALPSHYRAALVLSYYESFPNAMAAEIMDMHLKAFESLLVRARRQLRQLLDAGEFTLADFGALQ